MPVGSRWWRFKYRFAGKEERISLGVYPDVGLKQARDKREEARKQAKQALIDNSVNTFEAIAREWFAKHPPGWESSYSVKLLSRLEANIFPWIGRSPISTVKAPELLSILRRVESRGALETAHLLFNYCGSIFRYAIATCRAERGVSGDVRGALPPSTSQHHASITEPQGVAGLLRAIEGYRGSNVTKATLRVAPLVFVQPGELRKAEWIEMDLVAGEWRIPPERMKIRSRHIVPLSRQAADRQRLSQHGLDTTQRAGVEPRCHRAPARALGAQFHSGGLQLRRALTGATKDDASLGGLLTEADRPRARGARSLGRRESIGRVRSVFAGGSCI